VIVVERDCTFDDGGAWFRYRAAAVILDGGKVLMARNEVEPYYYSIGGGVHHMETAADAVRREVLEETGVAMEIERLAFIHENFFTGHSAVSLQGRQCHELTFYYLMKYTPDMSLSHAGGLTMDSVREWHEWVGLDSYGTDFPAYPTFFATELTDLHVTPKWITTRE
jgi:ADP-ribose pyrophosphatase YjhB (NUDIX family)